MQLRVSWERRRRWSWSRVTESRHSSCAVASTRPLAAVDQPLEWRQRFAHTETDTRRSQLTLTQQIAYVCSLQQLQHSQ